MFADMDESVADMLEYKDDGCIELVLKVLARICDGQHVGLQVYFIRSAGISCFVLEKRPSVSLGVMFKNNVRVQKYTIQCNTIH